VTTNWRGQAGIHLEAFGDVTGEAAHRLANLVTTAWQSRSLAPALPAAPGFDWRRIDAAIKALPRNRWTSYGELAELGGTAPVPLGQHVANVVIPNAHRVLDINGRVRPGFHWADPKENRDVRTVLQEDGIRFNNLGAADPSQRMTADDLAALIGDDGYDELPGGEPASPAT
jgi:alkylated DNA nucleotide flippase Atl1